MARRLSNESIVDRLRYATDRAILDLAERGREVVDAAGRPMLDDDGQPIRRQPTAADFAQIRSRLEELEAQLDRDGDNGFAGVIERLRSHAGDPDDSPARPTMRISGNG